MSETERDNASQARDRALGARRRRGGALGARFWRMLAAVALIALGGVACGDDSGAQQDDGPALGSCTSDADCAGLGLPVCNVAVEQCVECMEDAQCGDGNRCNEFACVPIGGTNNSNNTTDPDAGDTGDTDGGADDADGGGGDDDADVGDPDDADGGDPDDADSGPDDPDTPPPPDCNDLGCEGLQVCDTASGECQSAAICTQDIDCAGLEVCYLGDCQTADDIVAQGGCGSDEDCTGNTFCNLDTRTCLLQSACANDDACPDGSYCLDGACVECVSDGQCEAGQRCATDANDASFATCTEGPACSRDEECRGDRVCSDNACSEPACGGDVFGGSNTECFGAGSLNATLGYDDLEVCGDQCAWFFVDVAAGQGLLARMAHDPEAGDLDLAIYEECGDIALAEPLTFDPVEVASVPRALEAQTYRISVCPALARPDDEGTNRFDLSVALIDGGICAEDIYDQVASNDAPFDATTLPINSSPGRFSLGGLQVCDDAPDWYRVAAAPGELVQVRVEAPRALGDLRMELFDEQPFSDFDTPFALGQRTSTGLSAAAIAGLDGDVYVRLYSADGSNLPYRLSVDTFVACGDIGEPGAAGGNDTREVASILTASGEGDLITGLTLCGDEVDWHVVYVEPGQGVAAQIEHAPVEGNLFLVEIDQGNDGTSDQAVSDDTGHIEFISGSPDSNAVAFKVDQTLTQVTPYSVFLRSVDLGETCVDDRRNNNSAAQSWEIEPGVRGLDGRYCAARNDWFEVELPAGQDVRVELGYDDADGDLTLTLYNPDLSVLADGTPTEAGALASASTAGLRKLIVAVAGGESAPDQADYTLRVLTQPTLEGGCGEDALEWGTLNPDNPNNTFENATEVDFNSANTNLVLCPGDTDWYYLPVVGSFGFEVIIEANTGEPGALSAQLFDVFGPPDGVYFPETEVDADGHIVWIADAFDVFDGGFYALEVTGGSDAPVWYDVRFNITE